ncbi:hypothetical protein Tco_0631555 [Tanacetum coccineum]
MPIALKSNITRGQTSSDSISQDKCDKDEEINLMAKNFRKLLRKGVKKHDKFDICKEKTKGGSPRRERGCYNRGDKNHFIDDCPKSKRNKAFIGGAWSAIEYGNEPQNDATCLMAFDSQKTQEKMDTKTLSYTVNLEIRDHPIDQVIGELDERTLGSHAQDRSNFFAFVSTIEPKNIKEAIKDESWTMAMQEELDQFVCNDVWDLVPYPVPGRSKIPYSLLLPWIEFKS